MELYCVVSVVMEFLELGKYAKRGLRYDFPLNYLFEKETACSLRWTATRVLQISNRSPIYLSAAWTLSIQLSIDNWILISRFPSTHSLWYIFQVFVVCLFVVFSYSFIDTFIILILAELSVVCTQNTKSHIVTMESNQGAVHENRYSMKIKNVWCYIYCKIIS